MNLSKSTDYVDFGLYEAENAVIDCLKIAK